MLVKKVGYHRHLLALCAIALTAFFFIILANSVQASDSVNGSLNQTLMTKEDAAQMMIATVAVDINDSSFRMHQYPALIDAGSKVRQAVTDESKASEYLACERQSWLFFIDLSPGAHFAHPAIIALLDAVSGEIKSMDAEWWPVIEVPVFDSTAKRQDPSMIVFER